MNSYSALVLMAGLTLSAAACAPPGYHYETGSFIPTPDNTQSTAQLAPPPPPVSPSCSLNAACNAPTGNALPCAQGSEYDPETKQCLSHVEMLVQKKIRKYCASSTPAYCYEYRDELMNNQFACNTYISVAINVFGYKKLGWPPQTTFRIMTTKRAPAFLDEPVITPTISTDDVAFIIRAAYADQDTGQSANDFARKMYQFCLKQSGLDG